MTKTISLINKLRMFTDTA